MANSKSALKRARQNDKRRDRNRSSRSRVRTAVKKLRTAIDAGDAAAAREQLPATVGLINSIARKGVVHPNAAARTTSRLTRAVAKLDS